jgi:hypothetical protein
VWYLVLRLGAGCVVNESTSEKSTVTEPGRGPRPTQGCSASKKEEKNVILHYIFIVVNLTNSLGLQSCKNLVSKNTIFWFATPGILVEVYRRFGGTYHHHLQGRGTG